ncbi:beta-N-acetylhexosaminidase [Mucilaginibacter boryungensis]|uniref:beta-N-acetylhexosaminidase n=1 Tax=Mucilaginibacter boryungensis TaxID=768480 RepID=A0ABR9XF87_9SPHI|nr:beta-N-acetylhexosaminidase [Mucilaginibacter boryungensis]MBE9665739.1 beta-N-acetylhexosaminidase [Mucilaginibacter boryungensis]
MKKITICLTLLLGALLGKAQQNCPIIPKPVTAIKQTGEFVIKRNMGILISAKVLDTAATYLQKELQHLNKLNLAISRKAATSGIKLMLDNTIRGSEGYRLKMTTTSVMISGSTTHGVFNGVISFLQLVTLSKSALAVDCWDITDAPNYAWRGVMLDESRHFMGKEKVKQLLDWMAFYKLNHFHWHLTDEPAWRLEIKRYPKLALIGGMGSTTNKNDPAKYYTQQEVSEIINYAAERHIVVIPEIDMPGHATAANRAYPEYSGGGSPGHPDFTFNPGNMATYTYLANILKETIALFPSGMIHMGGDEVSIGNEKWKTDAGIASLMQQQKLSTLSEVEHYFMKRMADSVYRAHAKLLVWDEMANAGLPVDSTIIFWWRHDKPGQLRLALSKGYPTVVCPRLPFYYDFVQDSTHKNGRKWNNKLYNSLQDVYSFSLTEMNLTQSELNNVLGIQANLWTETVATAKRMDYLLFPRITALAEAAWTAPANKAWPDFMSRLKFNLGLYDKAGLYYYDPFIPVAHPEPIKQAGGR